MSTAETIVHSAWQRLGRELSVRGDLADTWQFLQSQYSESWRAYHNLDHIADCLAAYCSVAAPAPAMELAILFHAAVYVIGAPDNESLSADAAEQRLLAHGAAPSFTKDVGALIRATDHKSALQTEHERLLCDIDLSILGRDEAVYDAYAEAILAETAMTRAAFAAPRAAFLEGMLRRAQLFHTERFRSVYELAARENMRRELVRLRRSR